MQASLPTSQARIVFFCLNLAAAPAEVLVAVRRLALARLLLRTLAATRRAAQPPAPRAHQLHRHGRRCQRAARSSCYDAAKADQQVLAQALYVAAAYREKAGEAVKLPIHGRGLMPSLIAAAVHSDRARHEFDSSAM